MKGVSVLGESPCSVKTFAQYLRRLRRKPYNILFAYIFSFIRMQLIPSTSSSVLRWFVVCGGMRVTFFMLLILKMTVICIICVYYIVHIIFIPVHSATDGQKGLVQYKVYNLKASTTCKNDDDDDFDFVTIFRDILLDFNRCYYYFTQ